MGAPLMRRLPRVSLLSLLLLTALVSVSTALFVLWRELAPLRAELARYRNELGVLTISDPSYLHAIRIHTDEAMTWRWRLRIPEGAAYYFGERQGKLGGSGDPGPAGTGPLWPGEYVVSYRVCPTGEGEKMRARYSVRGVDRGATSAAIAGEGTASWAEGDHSVSVTGGVDCETRSFPPGERVVICRHRVSKGSISGAADDLQPGFMIWLSPEP